MSASVSASLREQQQRMFAHCPLTIAERVIGGKWKTVIIWWLSREEHGFGALRRRLPGISPKVLARQLRELVAAGLVTRRTNGPPHRGIGYALTPIGTALRPILEQLCVWGSQYRDAHPQHETPS